jgi:hypothetical protein
MEYCPSPSVHTPTPFPTYNPSSQNHCFGTDSSTGLVLKSEDPGIDEELLNLKLERLRLLQQFRELENSSYESNSNSVSPTLTDEDFAKILLKEEITAIKKTGKTQEQVQQEITQQVETLIQQDPDFAQNLSNLEKDEKFARLLEKQYLQTINRQIDEDETLARKLYEEEILRSGTVPGSSPVPINKFNGKKILPVKPTIPPQQYFPMNRTSPQNRKHAVEVHNRFCDCKKTSLGNNGHIFKTHDENCKCLKLHLK